MLLSKAFPSFSQNAILQNLQLKPVSPETNNSKKPYVCKAEPFNDMGHCNCFLEWKNNEKPPNYKKYETIIEKELWDKVDKNVVSYIEKKKGEKYGAQFFKTKSNSKSDNIFRYYLADVFVRIDLNNLNY